jgi:hypothetical protein
MWLQAQVWFGNLLISCQKCGSKLWFIILLTSGLTAFTVTLKRANKLFKLIPLHNYKVDALFLYGLHKQRKYITNNMAHVPTERMFMLKARFNIKYVHSCKYCILFLNLFINMR